MKTAKRLLTLTLFGLLTTNLTIAQDLITKTNGEDIKAKVLEVTTTEIKFKKTEMPDSPIYSVLKTDVLIIRYENGTKDVFNNQPAAQTNTSSDKVKSAPKKREIEGKRISFGVKGGLNYSNLTSGDYNEPIISYHAGGFLEYKLNGIISLQPELQFSAQGYKLEYEIRQNFDDPITTESHKYTLNYINLPILVKFNVSNVVNLVAGPQVGFLAYAKDDKGKDIIDSFNTFDYGIDFGAGLTFNKIIIDLRYNLGLAEVFKNDFPFAGDKNSVIQLAVGYKF